MNITDKHIEEEVHEEIVSSKTKSVLATLNKEKISKYELDEIFT
jgi:hypothetical protein